MALSSTEAEYVALSHATSEACWLSSILCDFGISVGPIVLYEDNQSTIKIANMATGVTRVKHLDIKLSFVKEKIDKKIIIVEYVSSDKQVADILTKALGGVSFKCLRGKLFN